jgi:hypothetical protein
MCAATCVCDTVEGAAMKYPVSTASRTNTTNGKLRSWAYFVFFVTFVLRTFYSVAIRRCKPGPIRLP